MAWLQFLILIVEHVGLWSDSLEPCVYDGQIAKDGHEFGFSLYIIYIDVILLLSITKKVEEYAVSNLSPVVPIKIIGEIGEEGGLLNFIDHIIKIKRDSSEIILENNPHYLNSPPARWGFLDFI